MGISAMSSSEGMLARRLPALMLAACLLGGCVEAGYDARLNEYGVATQANFVATDAYKRIAPAPDRSEQEVPRGDAGHRHLRL